MNKCELGGKCQFMIEGIDLEKKSVPVILSDESDVIRYNYRDGKYFMNLLHGDDNVDLERKDILSLFINHNTYELPIGKFENVRLEDKKLKADAVFDEADDESMKIFNKLAKGFLKSFSVGIDVISKELSKEIEGVKYYDITKWALNEASVVGIPAIPNAKVGMDKETDSDPMGVNPASAQIENQNKDISMEYTKEKFEALEADHAEALKEGGQSATLSATTAERKRVSDIIGLNGNAEFTKKAIDEGSTVGDAAIALVKAQGEENKQKKIDFEKASEDLNGNDEGKNADLSEEELAKQEADKALDGYGKDK